MSEERRIYPPAREFPFGPEWFKMQQLTENVWGIYEPFHDEDVLSYLIKGTNGSVLIDTGMGLADISSVSEELKNAKILLTHSHWDHVGGAPDFVDVSIYNHTYEVDRLKKGWSPEEMSGFTENHFHTDIPDGFIPELFSIPGISQFSTFAENDIISLGDITIQVVHTPGHTPGSVCFFIPEKGFLFTGDTLYAGPEYLHLDESDFNQYFHSLEKLQHTIRKNLTTIFPGHNNFTESPELLDQHILALQGKLEPISVNEGVDEFGAYVEKKWQTFSFKLPNPK